MTYGVSSSGAVKQASPSRAVLREYEQVMKPLGERYETLARFVASPTTFTGSKRSVLDAAKGLDDLLNIAGVGEIISSWWGETQEVDGNNAVIESMRLLQRQARSAVRELKLPVRAAAKRAGTMKKK
jgi:uncharacterized protein YidB (DUF937 family)